MPCDARNHFSACTTFKLSNPKHRPCTAKHHRKRKIIGIPQTRRLALYSVASQKIIHSLVRSSGKSSFAVRPLDALRPKRRSAGGAGYSSDNFTPEQQCHKLARNGTADQSTIAVSSPTPKPTLLLRPGGGLIPIPSFAQQLRCRSYPRCGIQYGVGLSRCWHLLRSRRLQNGGSGGKY